MQGRTRWTLTREMSYSCVYSVAQPTTYPDQKRDTQEDLDLVAYSTMSSFQAPQGMPLKAVYQGAVVGLRYQHPRVAPPGQTPVGFFHIPLVFLSIAQIPAIQTVSSHTPERSCRYRPHRLNPLRMSLQSELRATHAHCAPYADAESGSRRY